MRLAVPCRTTAPGAELRLLVLASSRRELIGVDLESGAFVRAHHPDRETLAYVGRVLRKYEKQAASAKAVKPSGD